MASIINGVCSFQGNNSNCIELLTISSSTLCNTGIILVSIGPTCNGMLSFF